MISIRDYRHGDAAALARLFYETVHSVNLRDYSAEQVEAWAPEIPDPVIWHRRMIERCTLVAIQDGEPVGFAELESDGHLDMFYCRNDVVGRGVGTQLHDAVEAKAVHLGLARIFTEASITARPFFERRGFRILGEQSVLRRGLSMINFRMEKHLVPL
jgi:GNAT superfamily N-acetyltransferase